MKNLYEVLQVSVDADIKEIKKSYKKLAKKYHPDLNPNNKEYEEKFKEISNAYEILSDETKRSKYNREFKNKNNNESNFYGEKENKNRTKQNSYKTTNIDFENISKEFESFFGFNPKSKNINKNFNKKTKSPIDTSDMFESFFKSKKF